MDPVKAFLARRNTGEVVLMAVAAGLFLFVCGIEVGQAFGSL